MPAINATAWLSVQVCVTYRNCQNCPSSYTLNHMPQSVTADSQLTGTLENATDAIIFPHSASFSDSINQRPDQSGNTEPMAC